MPGFTQYDVFCEAAIGTQDMTFVRWPPKTLNKFLNAAIHRVAIAKPNSVSVTAPISLVPGSVQHLTPPDFALIRLLRNTSGSAITSVEREIMDGMVPGWADETVYPATANVKHVLFDPAEPDLFQVYPSNTGAGAVVAVVARLPDDLAEGVSPDDATTYTVAVPLDDIYRQPLIDYVIHRCFAIDAELPDAMAMADRHLQLFNAALGLRFKAERIASPKTTNMTVEG